MFRSICTVFVVLAIIQAAFANVAVKYEFINLELVNETIPANDLFDGVRASELIGNMETGQRMDGETIYTFKYRIENYERKVSNKVYLFGADRDKKIHYVRGVNENGITAVICPTEYTLGYFAAFVEVRQPPNSESLVTFTVGAH